jgi:hypothetical protein
MTYKLAVASLKSASEIQISYRRSALCILISLLFPLFAFAAKDEDSTAEEISVTIEFRGLGAQDIPAIIHNKDVLLSVSGVFDFLKVKNTATPSFDTISGFYINQQDLFLMDKPHNRIFFKDKSIDVQPADLVRTESGLYMNLALFKTVFGLDGTFNFRRLLVTMTSSAELPAIREMRLELMRKNIGRLKGEMKADTVVKRSYPLFHLGAADWAIQSTQQNLGNTDTRFNLGLGSLLAGGEANASLNYYSSQKFSERQQYYQWHFVDNSMSALRQVVAGKIFTQSVASLYAPLVGVQINNIPTIQRRTYGTYTLSNTTEPGWIVELYINDVLVDYKKADASGFYSFEVPLIYGYSVIKLRFYGPWGEERTIQQYLSVPFNFIPAGEFEYSATAGIVEDGSNSLFSRVTANYGLSKRITVGGGYEYLSSISSGSNIPFVNTSVRLMSQLMLTGEYDYKVKGRSVLSYRLPSNVQFDLDYTKYDPNQTAIFYRYLEERKAVVTMPIRSFGSSIFSRLVIDQIILPYSKFTNAEFALAGSTHGLGVNFTTYASFTPNVSPYTYSILGLSHMLWSKYFTTIQSQYDFREHRPDFVKLLVERHLFGKGYLNVALQEYFNSNNANVLVGLRYDFSVARVSVSALTGTNHTYSRVETASGSLLFDGKTNYIDINNRSNVGKGGIVVMPYLDINCNGRRDPDEPAAPGLKLHVNGGRTTYSDKDSTIRITELDPYTNYYIELDKNSFDNISWQITKRVIKVTIIPNNFTRVDIPVAVQGEVSGTVSVREKDSKEARGMGQMIVYIYNSDSTIAARLLTESDGFFSYLGLAPGSYTVKLDTAQLRKLHMIAAPLAIPVTIQHMREGDVADNLEFALHSDIPKRPEPPVVDTSLLNKTVTDSVVAIEPPHKHKHKKGRRNADATEDEVAANDNAGKHHKRGRGNRAIAVDARDIADKKSRAVFSNSDTTEGTGYTVVVRHSGKTAGRKGKHNNALENELADKGTGAGDKTNPLWRKLGKILYQDVVEFMGDVFKE